jgi:hypothetical protein
MHQCAVAIKLGGADDPDEVFALVNDYEQKAKAAIIN